MIVIKIDPAKIKDVIGPGGKVINKIIADTGVEKIDIEDDGKVFITSLDGESGDKARDRSSRTSPKRSSSAKPTSGTVTRIIPIGAFVQILPGKEGLVHISQLAPHARRARSKTSSKSATSSWSRSWRSTAKAASTSHARRCWAAVRATAIRAAAAPREFTPREFTPRDAARASRTARRGPSRPRADACPGAPPMRRRRRPQGRHDDE